MYIYVYMNILPDLQNLTGFRRAPGPGRYLYCIVVTPGLRYKIPVFSDPAPGKS